MFAALGLSGAGCAAEEPMLASTNASEATSEPEVRSRAEDEHLLVRVHLGARQSISFQAAPEGNVIITQTGEDGTAPLEISDDPLIAFQEAAPGYAIPDGLAAAIDPSSPRALGPVEPVVLHLEAPVAASAFPARDFICWARNRYTCLYNRPHYNESYHQIMQRSYNAVWAVDRDWVQAMVLVYTPASGAWPPAASYHYNTYDGQWRTWSITGNVGVSTSINTYNSNWNLANFHFSSAGAQ